MDAYPGWAELVGQCVPLTACQFPDCRTECRNFKQLLDHIKGHHSVTAVEIRHHWIHEMAIHERNPQELGQGEYDHAQLVWAADGHVDEDKVSAFEPRARARVQPAICNGCGLRELSRMTARYIALHFPRGHPRPRIGSSRSLLLPAWAARSGTPLLR